MVSKTTKGIIAIGGIGALAFFLLNSSGQQEENGGSSNRGLLSLFGGGGSNPTTTTTETTSGDDGGGFLDGFNNLLKGNDVKEEKRFIETSTRIAKKRPSNPLSDVLFAPTPLADELIFSDGGGGGGGGSSRTKKQQTIFNDPFIRDKSGNPIGNRMPIGNALGGGFIFA